MQAWTQLWATVYIAVLQLLNWFHSWIGDYGVAIIVLTAVMRIVMIPLTVKQTKSMQEMQEIQPKIKALQEKYKNNKEKLNEETMKFYQENKVNPFGGCLPLLIQMPVFIALFRVLGTPPAKEAAPWSLINYIKTLPGGAQQAAKHFLFLISDITKSPQAVFAGKPFLEALLPALPYLALVALFGISVWLPQYMLTKDPQQRKMGSYMALFMLYIGWISPAGVLIYWVTSSAWQVAQQWLIMRRYGQGSAA
ncbi:MAG TPA: YidC/Oxa1 family membrane protein insertase [Coriobacteriia bacterium]